MNDPISDMLTRVRNGLQASHSDVVMPASKIKAAIASVLVEEGYVTSFEEEGEGVEKKLRVTLKYSGRTPVITGMSRISKPSCRTYAGAREIPRIMGGLGIVIMSTPDGVMTGQTARRKNVGGEVLCKVW
jgi:small subunit ribosomal protein S8